MVNHFHLVLDEQDAERLERREWKESELGLRPKGDKVKIALAKRFDRKRR
jgi:hypothetical protein